MEGQGLSYRQRKRQKERYRGVTRDKVRYRERERERRSLASAGVIDVQLPLEHLQAHLVLLIIQH